MEESTVPNEPREHKTHPRDGDLPHGKSEQAGSYHNFKAVDRGDGAVKILVIGRKLNGKGEFARALSKHIPNSVSIGTSAYLVHRLALIHGLTEEDILADKEHYRPELIDLGNKMCDVDPGCLSSLCLWYAHGAPVIVDGVRRQCEFDRVKDWFDMIIWVERPDVEEGFDNFDLQPEWADIIIYNVGSLIDLDRKAKVIAQGVTTC